MSPNQFDELKKIADEDGIAKSLDFLEHHFRRGKEFFKLFEVLKMRCRHQMGLPLIYSEQPDNLSEEQQALLEKGLLASCREIGTLLIKNGQLQDGWMYLQPVGDNELSEKLVRSVTPDDDNIDTIIEIAVSQGAAPAYGYELLLKQYGTCNGITTFDTQANRFDKTAQRSMAKLLLNHLYEELLSNIQYSIKETGTEFDEGSSLEQILEQFPDLMNEGAHHIDTTHLASLMRIARLVDDEGSLKKMAALSDYGQRLAEDFQYPGMAPFEDTYKDHSFFYHALTGKNVEAAVEHFRGKLKTVSVEEFGPVAHETLVEFLIRLGRKDEALSLMTNELLGKYEPMGIAPTPFEIAETDSQRSSLMEFYQRQDDLLGFAISMLKGK